ncbi:LysR family transcriptional regulator [Aliamphritea hakodatensis]|uniref:LysR family transcriptional regulator n=1 Tax=Aliamphritea hakodatensis TaxID=2895352 RepID=UPI0022FD7428|nr:LysR family transcriptional regulator [Aliamphritea hakodatensis]
MRFELRHIKYFKALAEELHFRRTAELLGVAQPALSRTIKHLENELEVQLFERNNRNVKLTEAGKIFLEGCIELINSIETTIENTRQVSRGKQGILRIGYTDFAIAGVLPEILTRFRDEYPGIVLQPNHSVTTRQLSMLETDQLDVGFITGQVCHPGFNSCEVQRESYVCLVYEAHPLAECGSISLQELADEDFILGPYKDWKYFYDYLTPLCHKAGFVPNIIQEAFNSAGILGLVACGMGITILTENTYYYANKGIVALELNNVTEQLVTSAIWLPTSGEGPKQTFISSLQETYLTTEKF